MSQKEELLKSWQREAPITLRLLRAYPDDRADFRPHEKSQRAIQLAWMFVKSQITNQRLLDGTFTFPAEFPTEPKRWNDLISAFESELEKHLGKLKYSTDDDLLQTIKIIDPYAGPGQWKDLTKAYFMWFLLCDHIHHRGQLSVYQRLAGGKVPSIYGPSADDPWQ
ncbi:MAG: hypothetical protein C5B54_08685 [Acidobacteria bacterium]|nr:MAG: hypothetical protein C5B54_08685 [Acidobacteriota bacterium]